MRRHKSFALLYGGFTGSSTGPHPLLLLVFIYKVDSLLVAGKTGTVENPHGDDHSMFIAFAPFDDPKIAISVIVENSGFGSSWATPIATLIIEKYLLGEIKRLKLEERMINGNLINNK